MFIVETCYKNQVDVVRIDYTLYYNINMVNLLLFLSKMASNIVICTLYSLNITFIILTFTWLI